MKKESVSLQKSKTQAVREVPWQRTLFILFFAALMVSVGFSSVFPFLPLYIEQLGSTTGLSIEFLSGLVYSGQSFSMMLASPIWGVLADRRGRKIMVERSMFGGAVILLMMAFVTSAEQLVVLRIIQGLVTGTVSAASALLASVTPRYKTGYAMGLLQVGFGAGFAVGPLIGGAVADNYGYNAVFYITAVLLFLAGVTVSVLVREKFDPKSVRSQQGTNVISTWRLMVFRPTVFITFVLRFLTSMGRMIVYPIIPLFIQALLLNDSRLNTFTGLVLGISSGATTVSSVFLGKLGDLIGYRKILIFSMGVLAGVYALQGYVTAGWQLLVLQAFAGIAFGGVIPIISALLANYAKVGEEGMVFGVDNSITAAGRAAAPLLGAAIATGWGYTAAFVATGFVFLISTLFAIWRLPFSQPIAETSLTV